jgi:photosystem II stability/assembly factor-like uncharacterized protein
MKSTISLLVALFSVNGAIAQWTSKNILPQGYLLSSVYFSDPNTGFVVGQSGTILKTNDAGANWTSLSSGTTSDLRSVFFTDSRTGYAVGSYSSRYTGIIIKTIDGGTTWNALPSGTIENLNSVYFTNVNTGFAVGENLTILRTINGGATWANLSLAGSGSLASVFFADDSTGYAVGGYSGVGILLKTNDGGITWSNRSTGSFGTLFSVFSIDASTTYAVGGNLWYRPIFSEVLKMTGGDSDLNMQISSNSASLKSVYFTDSNTGYAVGDFGTLLKTSNAGVDWYIQDSGTQANLTSVCFTDANTGYIAGDSSLILKTINGGGSSSGVNEPSSMQPSFKIYPNPSLGNITIETTTSPGSGKLSILNLNGMELMARRITGRLTQINLSSLPGGVYVVKLIDATGVQVRKIIKE